MVGGAHVSRRHAEFSVRGGALWVKDLGSSNGSFINGKKHDEFQLKNGDEVKFDAMVFKVVGPTEPVVTTDFEEEAERTQFRPVAGAAKAAPAASPAPKPPGPEPQHPPRPSSAPTLVPDSSRSMTPPPMPQHQPQATQSSAQPKSNVGVIVTVILIVIGVLAALFLL